MKFKINHLFLSIFIVLFVSCSSDDTPKQEVLAETVPIVKEIVFENIIVEGATKKTGTPNTPNEIVSFTLNKKNTSAVMIDGFDVEFNSEDDIIGAYLQIKDSEGNLADGFYDIDLSKVGKKSQYVKNKKRTNSFIAVKQSTQKHVSDEKGFVVDVDFKEAIEPGIFCYVICVYDAKGNISAPQEVCVTVQSWGGNDDLAGIWNNTKTESFEDGETTTVNVGTKDCYELTLNCTNGSIIKYNECLTIDSFKFTINIDGTYVYEIKTTNDYINYSASRAACEAVVTEEKIHNISKGNWAYDQEKGEIIIVELVSIDTEEDETTEAETYDAGDAEIFVLKAVLNGNNLTLGEEFLDEKGTVEEYFKYYFDKE